MSFLSSRALHLEYLETIKGDATVPLPRHGMANWPLESLLVHSVRSGLIAGND